ncbi:MAG: uroporphyrinogen decarboxylase [Halobacteriales archaeon]
MHELFARALRGERTERPPVWLMRQAGRYLPRYRELRERYAFREAVATPAVAEEISLLPYERFGVDGVVMFADILEVLAPLGIEYRIEPGVGPVVETPVREADDVPGAVAPVDETLGHVGALLERLRASLGDDATTIGFAGGPFTVGSYLVAGEPTRSHRPIRRLRVERPAVWEALLDVLTEATIDYLQFQVEHGAEVVQLFDTYAGHLSPAAYREWLLDRHRRILESVDVPTIVFARGMGGHLEDLAATGATAVSLDWTVDLAAAREALGPAVPVQGNLDPVELLGDRSRVATATTAVIEAGERRGHVLNLGHGVLPGTPPENVAAFVETAKRAAE